MAIHRIDKFSDGLRWMGVGRILGQIFSWTGTIYVMRLLSPADYGLAAISMSLIAMISVVAEMGLGAGLIQAEEVNDDQLRSLFTVSLAFGLAGTLLVMALAPAAGIFFQSAAVVPLVQVGSLQLLIASLAVIPDAMLRRMMRFKAAAIVELLSGLVASAATVYMAFSGWAVWSLVMGPMVGLLARVILLNFVLPSLRWPSLRYGASKDIVAFGLKVSLSRVASYVFSQSDVLIAGRFLDKSAVGAYSVAMNLATLPLSKAMGVLNHVAYPAIADLRRSQVDVRPHLAAGLRVSATAMFPLLWGLAAVSPWLLPAVLGPHWESAVLPMQIVCVALPLRMISVLMSTAVQGLGHPGTDLVNTLTGVVVMPTCFLVGVQFGVAGLAAAWLVGLPLVIFLNLRRAQSVLMLSGWDALRALAKPMACSAVMAALVYGAGLVLGPTLDKLLIVVALILIGLGVYTSSIAIFDPAALRILMRIVLPSRFGPNKVEKA